MMSRPVVFVVFVSVSGLVVVFGIVVAIAKVELQRLKNKPIANPSTNMVTSAATSRINIRSMAAGSGDAPGQAMRQAIPNVLNRRCVGRPLEIRRPAEPGEHDPGDMPGGARMLKCAWRRQSSSNQNGYTSNPDDDADAGACRASCRILSSRPPLRESHPRMSLGYSLDKPLRTPHGYLIPGTTPRISAGPCL